jgi:AcrR family transcriptional regulator
MASQDASSGRGRSGTASKKANAENDHPPRPAARRRRDREKTIADILDAAEHLLEEKGPDGFGLAELGREADISFGLIHHYFGGKQGLLRAVLRRTLREVGEEVRRVQADGSFWNRDAPAVLAVFDIFTNRPGFARLAAWGLLTGLIDRRDVENDFRVDREAFDQMLTAFRNEAPADTRDDVSAITALLLSAVLGFNLLRPFMTKTREWSAKDDERLRDLLAKAMVGLTYRR